LKPYNPSWKSPVVIQLPGTDEVVLCVDEEPWWELVDATHGALVDGEPVDLTPAGTDLGWRRRTGDHLGPLLPEGTEVEWGGTATLYATIPSSGLTVVLR
jgi:hypothetical protein